MSEWTQVATKADVPEDGTYPASLNGEPVCLYNVALKTDPVKVEHDVVWLKAG